MAKLATARDLAGRFDRRARGLERLGDEAERLRGTARISLGSADRIYESAFLNLATAFELFIEDLFFSTLLGHSGIEDAAGAVHFRDRAQAEVILRNGRPYIDWLPFDRNVRKLGDRVLVNSPFGRLDRHARERKILKEMTVIRHAIAHESGSARANFAPMAAGLRARRRTPAGLLQESRQGVRVQVEYSVGLRAVASALAATTLADAKQLLSPEEPYRFGEKPGKGTYECVACAARRTLASNQESLPRCSRCGAQAGVPSSKTSWRRTY